MKTPQILECTLRDGSYANDFQFTAIETEQISHALDEAGFPYIEVGHGLGLGASEQGKHVAIQTDEEYLKATSKSVQKGKWGMFCIPGIAKLDHLRLAADHGMDFVRIGTNVTEVDSSEKFISLARDLGLEVCANFMKSYAIPPKEFAQVAKKSTGFGAQVIYLVDSAGGMLPNEVRSYIRTTKLLLPNIKLGFHGHNNLGLSVANSLVCVEEGVDIIDTSLQGYGRSAGNTPTEQFICALIRSGIDLNYSSVEIMQMGESLIRPRINRRGLSSLDLASGQALFHSSYMPIILDVAKRERVDPRELIIDLCKQNMMEAPAKLVESIAQNIKNQNRPIIPWDISNYFGEEQN
jgi:4-hydroxy 2-oxovalerate aldolase